jgi:hypothetical protein
LGEHGLEVAFEESAGVLEVLFGSSFGGRNALKDFIEDADDPLLFGERRQRNLEIPDLSQRKILLGNTTFELLDLIQYHTSFQGFQDELWQEASFTLQPNDCERLVGISGKNVFSDKCRSAKSASDGKKYVSRFEFGSPQRRMTLWRYVRKFIFNELSRRRNRLNLDEIYAVSTKLMAYRSRRCSFRH